MFSREAKISIKVVLFFNTSGNDRRPRTVTVKLKNVVAGVGGKHEKMGYVEEFKFYLYATINHF